MRAQVDFSRLGPDPCLTFHSPRQVLQAFTLDEVPQVIAAAEAAALQGHWVVGMVAYEAAPAFDGVFTVKEKLGAIPLACFAVYGAAQPEKVARTGPGGTAVQTDPWIMEIDRQRFEEDMAGLQEDIRAGRFYQSNHTSRLHSRFSGEPFTLYQALCEAQPKAYRFYLDGGDWQVLSVSPELFFDWQPSRSLVTKPMKGTAPRFDNPRADAAAAEALQASVKERAENLMIVDLMRNDLSRIAQGGSVSVPHLFSVEALPSVWQMTSTVQCLPRAGTGLVDVFAALFPCGSITGAPKVTAMQSIAEREISPRGPYCGALGLIRPGGHATFSVGIRTVVLQRTASAWAAQCGIGSGITLDATVAGEYAEWQTKRRFLLRASAGFRLIETLRLEAGRFPLVQFHLERLAASAEHFGFSCDRRQVLQVLNEVATAQPAGCWRVRLLLDREGACDVRCAPLPDEAGRSEFLVSSRAIRSDNEFLRHKTTERRHYDEHRPQQEGVDVLLFNEKGQLTEFTRGNLVLEIRGKRVTPPLACGLLPGVMRSALLAKGDIEEAVVTAADLARAERVWLINAVRGWVEMFPSSS